MRVAMVLAVAGIMVALIAGVSEAQNTFITDTDTGGTWVIQGIPSGVDNRGVPLGVDSGKGRDSYTNYYVTPPSDDSYLRDFERNYGMGKHKTKRVVIEVEDD
jgi:hypothetical protein